MGKIWDKVSDAIKEMEEDHVAKLSGAKEIVRPTPEVKERYKKLKMEQFKKAPARNAAEAVAKNLPFTSTADIGDY
jgi:hypothetical protein